MSHRISDTRVRTALKKVFALDDFRPGQEEVVRAALDGRNTLAIMPTGAGKSLCYQLPAVLLPGMTLVISPLIALMKDQCDKLTDLGLGASQVNSSLTARETREAVEDIGDARPAFAITTPERFTQPDFLETLNGVLIDLIVIDEAHCISQWGHDFRPAYLGLGRAIKALGSPPLLALTATAPPAVIEDIRAQLDVPDLLVVNTGTFRPNLKYEVVQVEDDEMKQQRLMQLLGELEGLGIIYTATVKDANRLAAWLDSQGIAAERYHGRLGSRERHAIQERFMRGELKAIVATNAFGMGIDKSDIRFVVHYSIPGSVDAYYQESGRAGRDGEPARCILLFHKSDQRTHLYFLGRKYPNTPERVRRIHPDADDVTAAELAREYEERRARDRAKLDAMIAYAQSALCRWQLIMREFGEALDGDCGDCDNCRRAAARQQLPAAS